MQYRIMIIFICLVCLIGGGNCLNNSQTSFFWEPLEPLLFNEDVILKCFIKDCCPEDTQWTGGKTSSLLTLARVSNDKAKYEETWGADASYLKIKNFGIDDGDSLYTCFHGFSKYPKNLTIDGNNFALLPSKETLRKEFTVKDGYLNASVEFLKVYPEPVCNGTFQNLDITGHIKHRDFHQTTSLFLNGRIHIFYQICHKECLGTIQIDCMIGMHRINVLETMVDTQVPSCSGLHNNKDVIVALVACGITMAVIFIFIFILLWKFKVVELMKRNKDEPLEQESVNLMPDQLLYVGTSTDTNENTTSKTDEEDLLNKTEKYSGDMLLTKQPSLDQNLKDYKENPDACHKTNGSSGAT